MRRGTVLALILALLIGLSGCAGKQEPAADPRKSNGCGDEVKRLTRKARDERRRSDVFSGY